MSTSAEPAGDAASIGESDASAYAVGGIESQIFKATSAAEIGDIGQVVARSKDAGVLRQRLQCLQMIGNAALLAPDPKTLLRQVLDLLHDSFPSARGAVMWRVGDDDRFKCVAPKKREDVRVSRTVIQQVIESRAAVLSDDTRRDDRLTGSASVRAEQMVSVMCVPIVRGDQVAGVIHFDHKGFRQFGPGDLALVGAAATTLAAAITAMDQRATQVAAQTRRRLLETLRNASTISTPEGGIQAAGIHLAVGLDRAVSAGAFADAVNLPPLPGAAGEPPPVLLAMGWIEGEPPLNAVAAVEAHAIVRTLAPHGLQPGGIIAEVGRVLGVSLLADAGNAIIARWEPARGVVSAAAAGSPVVLRHAAATGEVSFIEVGCATPALGEPTEALMGAPTEIALEPGDTLLLLTEGEQADIEPFLGWMGSWAGEGPVALADAFLAEHRGYWGERPASLIAVRRG